ncbi:hypothetical protein C8R44DRAFT_801007 [Mycena epipterygia]|nr:hypothetical protein C8R44DRAFT_801007 [Mycena epipterygia]
MFPAPSTTFPPASSTQIRRRLKAESFTVPWGPGPKQQTLATFEECVGLPVEDYDGLGVRDAIQRLDHLLFSFTIHTNFTGSAPPSENLVGVDSLLNIRRDHDWVEALLAVHEETWMHGEFDGKGLALILGGPTSIREETSEAMVDLFAMREGDVASAACRYFPGVGPERITASVQVTTSSTGGSGTRDVLFYAHNQGERRPFERRQDKTLEVMVHYAHALDAIVDCGLDEITHQDLRGMFTQAYTSSVSQPRCITVWMGHPGLYRIAYIYQRCLFLSHWRSSEPVRIKSLLQLHKPWTSPILQAHLVHETLALAKIGVNEFDAFLRTRQPQNTVVNFVQVLKAPFDILRSLWSSQVVLGDDTFFGAAKFSSEQFALIFPETIKPRRVWANSKVVVKAVGAEELNIWRYIAGLNIEGVPCFKGTMTLSSKPNTGRTLIFLKHCGEPVSDGALDPEEVASATIRANVSTILRALRMHGIHHHDIHHGNVVMQGDRVFITDFGRAVMAHECTMGLECPDVEFMLEPEVPELAVQSSSQSSQGSSLTPASPQTSPLVLQTHALTANTS